MRVVTIKRFKDFQADVIREPGELWECSDERFAEIDAKLPGFVVCVEPDKPAEQTEGGQEGATEPDKPAETTADEQPAQDETKKAQSSKRASSK